MWANCGEDALGRPIGYAHSAECDEPGCDAKIDRGLAYACGGEHGWAEGTCEGYFCYAHLYYVDERGFVCGPCAAEHDDDDDDEDEE